MSESRVYRYEVPVDDAWHEITLGGPILHVASRDPAMVEFWATHHEGEFNWSASFRVFGTGQLLDDDHGKHIGTAIAAGSALVWHLFRREIGPSQ